MAGECPHNTSCNFYLFFIAIAWKSRKFHSVGEFWGSYWLLEPTEDNWTIRMSRIQPLIVPIKVVRKFLSNHLLQNEVFIQSQSILFLNPNPVGVSCERRGRGGGGFHLLCWLSFGTWAYPKGLKLGRIEGGEDGRDWEKLNRLHPCTNQRP